MEINNNYCVDLAFNIKQALPHVEVIYHEGLIYINLPYTTEGEVKDWLYSLLESLPEIDQPLQRIQFVVRIMGDIELMIKINPSEMDVQALDRAIEYGLLFSMQASDDWYIPMPLDHPWYTNKDYFRQLKKTKLASVNGLPSSKNKNIALIVRRIKNWILKRDSFVI